VRKDVYWFALAGWMSCSQVLYAAVVRPLKDSRVPEIAVTTDACLVEREALCGTRCRFAGRQSDPDGLESKDAEGEAARGDPAPMRSWLSCRCIWGKICLVDLSTVFSRLHRFITTSKMP